MTTDFRNIVNGLIIPTESYSDQPYIVKTDDGVWLCCVTTGPGHEGADGQHVAAMRSTDQGKSWANPVSVEPGDKRENSYAVMLKANSGRIFIFYNHNTGNVREIVSHNDRQPITRVDSLGHFVFKYSDDHGKSWSNERYDIPFRIFQCDRDNVYGGKLCFFWNVGKPFTMNGTAYVSLIKVGQMGRGFFQQSEGVLLASDNLLTEKDAAKIRWETLPDGDIGLRTPPGGGHISEEQSFCPLSDGSIYCVYRSIDGYPVECYSRDGGHTWSTPRYKCFADGRRMKHPRAANFTWRCENGNYLYWFHNHGGKVMREKPGNADGDAYDDRNPVWLSAGIEIATPGGREIAWSEPEIILYENDPFVRMSYPDLVEENGKYYLTETQKDIARVHKIPAEMLNSIWKALAISLRQLPGEESKPIEKCLLSLPIAGNNMPAIAEMPQLPWFRVRDCSMLDYRGCDTGEGISIELMANLSSISTRQTLLNTFENNKGFCLETTGDGALQITISDGQTENCWRSDAILSQEKDQHIVINIDGGPHIISFIIDGRFCDGGDTRQFGWGRFSPYLRHINSAKNIQISPSVKSLQINGQILLTSEAVMRYLVP